jgi:hypothetical protein
MNDIIKNLEFEIILQPPYSPDIVPDDFHILASKRNVNEEGSYVDMKYVMHFWFQNQLEQFYTHSIKKQVT